MAVDQWLVHLSAPVACVPDRYGRLSVCQRGVQVGMCVTGE